jgi:hypothetical protein
MAVGGVPVDVVLQRPAGGVRVPVERQLPEHRRGHDRRGAGEQPLPGKFRHA